MALSFNGQRAFEHVKQLAVEIGSRAMGSDGERRSADYIRSYLEGLGLAVREQAFPVEASSLRDHEIEVLMPDLGVIPSFPILLTPDTPDEGVTGELVLVEGSREPQVGPHLAGKIVLWSVAGRMEFLIGYRALAAHRPLAIILIWPALGVKPKHLLVCDTIARPHQRVTSFCISYEDALSILRAGAKKARVRLRSDGFEGMSLNIVGELKGDRHPEEIVIVGGHHDTMPDVRGAIDNASGVATVLELARLCAERGSSRTLRFVAWGGEEGGMLGSQHYVQELLRQATQTGTQGGGTEQREQGELVRHLMTVSLDGVGTLLAKDACYVTAVPGVTAYLETLAEDARVPLQLREGYYGSDSEMFVWAGVPGVSFGLEGPALAYLHTVQDTIELIDVVRLEQIGTFVDTLLKRTAASAQAWPFERQIPDRLAEEVVQTLKLVGWVREQSESRGA